MGRIAVSVVCGVGAAGGLCGSVQGDEPDADYADGWVGGGAAGGSSAGLVGIYELNSSGSTIYTPYPKNATFYMQAPIAIDGAGNAWGGNDDFNLDHSTGLVEVSNSGTTLSGATGFVSEQPAPSGFYGNYQVSGLGVDGSGNVWAALAYYPFVLQYVGVAAPVVTPLSVGVKNGTLGMRP